MLRNTLTKFYLSLEGAARNLKNDEGAGVVEIALIIIVIIALIVIFKSEMKELVEEIFEKIGSEWKSV